MLAEKHFAHFYRAKIHGSGPNRDSHRHFLPMPFEPSCFALEFFFDNDVPNIVRGVMDKRLGADQWGCAVPLDSRTFTSA